MLAHGTLVRVDGEGILLVGDPGVGKSSTALDLLVGGHQLIADDVVLIARCGERLVGSAPERVKGIISVPNIGIFDVRDVLGPSSFCDRGTIDRCIELTRSSASESYRLTYFEISVPTTRKLIHSVSLGMRGLTLFDFAAIRRSEAKFLRSHDKFVRDW